MFFTALEGFGTFEFKGSTTVLGGQHLGYFYIASDFLREKMINAN